MRTLPIASQWINPSSSSDKNGRSGDKLATSSSVVFNQNSSRSLAPVKVSPQQQKRLNSYKITEEFFCQTTMDSYRKAETVAIGVSSCLVSLFTMSYSYVGVTSTAPLFSLASLTHLAKATAAIVGITATTTVSVISLGCGLRWLMLYLRGDLDRCDAKLSEHEARYQSIQNGTDLTTQRFTQSQSCVVYVDDSFIVPDNKKIERDGLYRRMRLNHQVIRIQEEAFKSSNNPYLRSVPTYFAKSRYLSGPAATVMVRRGIQINSKQPVLDWQQAQAQAQVFEAAEFDDEDSDALQRRLDKQTGGLYSAYRKEECYRRHLWGHREYSRYIQKNNRDLANVRADRDYLEPQTCFGRLRIWWRQLLED